MSQPTKTFRLGAATLAVLVLAGGMSAVGTAVATGKPNTSTEDVRAVAVETTVIRSFLKSGEEKRDFGALRFLGGLVLRSSDRAFGGYSGLEIASDGTSIMAVSDAGTWLAGELVRQNGGPAGLVRARIGPLKALGGRPLRRSRDRDGEALRLAEGSLDAGIALIAFERNDRIGFFEIKDGQIGAPQHYLRPPRDLPDNKGLESVALLRAKPFKGRVVAFAERSVDGNGHHRGWIWTGEGPKAVALRDLDGFDITDIAVAPEGDLYILERRFRWSEGVQMRVRRIAARDVKPGATLGGAVLFQGDMRYEIDNMEGMALHRDRHGRLVLTLLSDDNFNGFLQRTLLLQFRVVE